MQKLSLIVNWLKRKNLFSTVMFPWVYKPLLRSVSISSSREPTHTKNISCILGECVNHFSLIIFHFICLYLHSVPSYLVILWVFHVCMHVTVCMCFSCFFFLIYFLLVCFYFPFCFLKRERKIGGVGRVGRWGRSGRIRGRGNCITAYCMKNCFQ